jgi:hypothetical protein
MTRKDPKPTDTQLADLARVVGATTGEEIDCAAMLDRVAPYLKALTERKAQSEHLRQAAQHLKICPECHEEFLALIKAEGLDPSRVLEA